MVNTVIKLEDIRKSYFMGKQELQVTQRNYIGYLKK